MNEAQKLIYALHAIHTPGDFVTTDDLHPETGEFMTKRNSIILKPDRIHSVSVSLADELFALAAKQVACGGYPCVRKPDARETLSYKQANGLLIERPAN